VDHAELRDLCDAYLDQRLDEVGRTALDAALVSSPEACRVFWDCVHQHALLGELLAEARGRHLAEEEVLLAACPLTLVCPAETDSDRRHQAGGSPPVPPRRRMPRRVAAWLSLTAAAVLIAAGTTWLLHPPPDEPAPGPGATGLARLGELKGHVRILAEEGLLKARPGQLLRPGQEVHTGEDSFAVVTYDDRSRLELSADTAVRLVDLTCLDRQQAPGKHIYLVRGVVNAHVTRQPAGRPLLLSTDQADLLVPGTRFASANIMGETRIELEEGTALFARKGARAVEIHTGTYVVAGPDLEVYSAAPLVPASGKPFAQMQEGSGPVLGLAALPGRRELAVACWSGLVKFWDTRSKRVTGAVDAGQDRALALTASADGRTLAVGYESRLKKDRPPSVVLWDLGERRARLSLPGTIRAHHLEFTPDQQSLVLATAQRGAQVRDLPLRGQAPELRERLVLGELFGRAEALAVSPDGAVAAVGYRDGKIRLWDLHTGRLVQMLEGHTREVKALAFQPGGQLLASGARDGTLRLWSTASGAEVRCLRGPAKEVRCLTFAPDGQTLASGHAGIALLWDVATGQKRSTLKAHKLAITALAYLDDGQTLATAGWDRTVKLWKLAPAAAPTP
jgi:ferric-dicitrate binding protein FerR (iron transport regulator)